MKKVSTAVALQAPVDLCRLLSPYTNKEQAASVLERICNDSAVLDKLVECANQHMVITTLFAQLRHHNLLDILPSDLRGYMQTMHEALEARNHRLIEQARFILATLNQADITPLLLKGGDTLFYDLYPSKGSRFMSDLDILMPVGTVRAGQEQLAVQGYFVPKKYRDSLQGRDPHHAKPIYRDGDDCSIELHYKPLNYKAGGLLSAELAFSESNEIDSLKKQDLKARTLPPTYKVLHCFAHSEICHGYMKNDALSILQMDYFVRLIHYYDSAIDWKALQQALAQYGFQEEFTIYCNKAERLFGWRAGENSLTINGAAKVLERRYQATLKSAIYQHYPGRRFYQGLKHLLGMYSRDRLAGIYLVDNGFQHCQAIVLRSHYHLKRFIASPKEFLNRLRQVFF